MEQEKGTVRAENELTIVTGFFDCGRGNHQMQARSNERYLDYFHKWARIKNQLIVYTSGRFAKRIQEIREEFGVGERTQIVIVNNLESIEPELFAGMKKVENNELFRKWRVRDYDVSNLAMYDYIMLMKYWMLKDAIQRNHEINTVVWLDFGWNHGGKVFSREEEFAFLWKYPFDDEKAHLFAKRRPEEEFGFIKLQAMSDGIMGSPVVASRKTCALLYEYVKEAMWSLLSLDAMDDDQMLLSMAYKRHPELFQIHESDWFLPMKEFGGEHLTVREGGEKNSLKEKVLRIKQRGIKKNIALFYAEKVKKVTLEKYMFEKRIMQIIKDIM